MENLGNHVSHCLRYSCTYFLTLEIRKPFTKPFIITTWYRPPGLSGDKCLPNFEQYLIKLDLEEKESIILGDFNYDLLYNPFSALTRDVSLLLESYQYTQFIVYNILQNTD